MSLCVLIVNPQWGLGQSGSGSRLYQRKLSLNVANNRVSHHLNANYQKYFFPIVKGDIIGNCAAQMTSNHRGSQLYFHITRYALKHIPGDVKI